MSKRGYISRYLLIIKKLKSKPFCNYEELADYIDQQVQFLRVNDEDLEVGVSKRTLQRDFREIRDSFGIDIEYSRSRRGYHILDQEAENMNFQRMMEAFELYNTLNTTQDVSPYIEFEKRPPQGTDNLFGLLHAIKHRRIIYFQYQKFWEDEPQARTIAPYALKEFRNRWYVVGKDSRDDKIKSFGLDRLTELNISDRSFKIPADFNIKNHFKYCFGVIRPEVEKPEEIILSFDPHQGKYIKTLPLHESQEILIDSDEELRIKLTLYMTQDLIMEIRSYGDRVKTISVKH